MSFIDEVRAKRKKLADVLSDEDYCSSTPNIL